MHQQPHRRLRLAMASAQGTSSSACAACRVLRRKCTAQCLFAPYFPSDQPQKFAHVHKVFGVANVTKMLHELPPPHREDCVNSLAYEADARFEDPVYGCVGSVPILQHQQPVQTLHVLRHSSSPSERLGRHLSIIQRVAITSVFFLKAQLALATSEITRLRETFAIAAAAASTSSNNTGGAAAAAVAAPGALLMAVLLPCSPSTQADPTSLNPAAGIPEDLPPPQLLQQAAPASVESRQPPSPVSCEHSPPLLL